MLAARWPQHSAHGRRRRVGSIRNLSLTRTLTLTLSPSLSLSLPLSASVSIQSDPIRSDPIRSRGIRVGASRGVLKGGRPSGFHCETPAGSLGAPSERRRRRSRDTEPVGRPPSRALPLAARLRKQAALEADVGRQAGRQAGERRRRRRPDALSGLAGLKRQQSGPGCGNSCRRRNCD